MADTSATYSFAADANWATFVGLVGGSTENLIYNVAALNLQGGTLNRFLTTTNADVTISTNRPTNSLLGTSYPSVNDYVDQTNLLTATRNASTHGATDDVDGSSIAFGDPTLEDGDDGLAYFGNGSGRRWNLAQSPFDTTESVGTALSFYELRRSSANAISRASMDLLPNQWLLATDGTLTYGAPVPEPETWAMLLAGGALLGAVRLRRRGA
ncbi:MAG: PEP-CTERM sorting domain-containing protein [Betaproteobacteria bacterium]|nr:PEP-CTERM sorting domain-containing protein [Betaproteobacteria bacterium]